MVNQTCKFCTETQFSHVFTARQTPNLYPAKPSLGAPNSCRCSASLRLRKPVKHTSAQGFGRCWRLTHFGEKHGQAASHFSDVQSSLRSFPGCFAHARCHVMQLIKTSGIAMRSALLGMPNSNAGNTLFALQSFQPPVSLRILHLDSGTHA